MNKAIQWGKDFWHSLDSKVQGLIVFALSTAATSLGDALTDPHACWQWTCIKHTLWVSVCAGIVAARTFYMRPGAGPEGRKPTNGPA